MRKSAVISVLAVAIVVAVSWFWVSSRSSLKRAVTKNNMKQLGLLIHNYHDALGKFPARDDVMRFESSSSQDSEPSFLQELEQDCVILWEAFPENFAALRETGEDTREVLIAYEKGADERGGYALFLDGAAREVSAEDFLLLLNSAEERSKLKREKAQEVANLQDLNHETYDPVKAIESQGGDIDVTSDFKYVRFSIETNQDISDADLIHLSHFPELMQVNLSGTQCTDEGLKHLAGLVNLEQLFLSRTQIQGSGLAHLSNMSDLEHLSLNSTKVTDDAVEHLSQLKNLKELKVIDTQLTEDGVKRLRDALPECRIVGP